jgi:hypothetical protein
MEKSEGDFLADAIVKAVDEFEQPKPVADRLVAWIRMLQTDPSAIDDRESVATHIGNLLEAIRAEENIEQ